jgi:hypothetical protein
VNKKELEEALHDLCATYVNDPYGFVCKFFDWGHGELKESEGPDTWQADVLNQIGEYCQKIQAGENPGALQLAVASGHGIGKSALVAWIIGWFMSTRDNPQIIVTANTETQLLTKTWRTLARWYKLMLNGHWFDWTATKFSYKQSPESWYAAATPWNENNPEAFAGTHDKHVLVIFDEASNIKDVIWEKIDGAMSTRGAMWICFGNPTRNTGRFFEAFHKYKKWWITRQIDSRDCKHADKVWADRFVEMFGLDADRTRYQILGKFPETETGKLISTSAVIRAQNTQLEPESWILMPKVMGVDVARFGDNFSTICIRQGRKVFPIQVLPKMDLMATAHHVAEAIRKERPTQVFVDGSGIGAGVVDRLRQLNFSVVDVNGGNQSQNPRFLNKRAETWWGLKEFIEDSECELPPDPPGKSNLTTLKEELTAVSYDYTDKGRIRLDRKEDLVKEHGFSPDKADALALTFAYPIADYSEDSMRLEPELFEDGSF